MARSRSNDDAPQRRGDMDHEIVILGIPIPSDDPFFLTTLAVHVPVGMLAVAAGLVAMLQSKGPGPHPKAGSVYYWSLCIVFITASVLSFLRWVENYHLFILGLLAFAAASLGRTARRLSPPWLKVHVISMSSSYVLMLPAFYVDNGKNFPLCRELPQWAFWVLPSLFGIPIIIRALLTHPILRQVSPR